MTVLSISLGVVDAYRRHWQLLLGAAVLLFLPLNAFELLVPEIEADHLDAKRIIVALSLSAGSLAVSAFEEAFYEGITATAAEEWRSGVRRPSLIRVARSVPYLVLIVLNLVIALVTGVGLLLLVVPGVVLSTYVGLAPALAKMEHLGAGGALRRSVELVRGHFWTILVLLWGVYLASELATSLLDKALENVAAEFLAKTVAESLIAPFYGLAAVLAAYELIGGRAGRPLPGDGPRP